MKSQASNKHEQYDNTFCLSLMNTRLRSSGLLMSFANCSNNQIQLSLFSCSTTTIATENILSFPSLVVVDSNCTKPTLQVASIQPNKWSTTTQKPKFLSIVPNVHPFCQALWSLVVFDREFWVPYTFKLGLCILIFHLYLQYHLASNIYPPYHFCIVSQQAILRLFIPSDQTPSYLS